MSEPTRAGPQPTPHLPPGETARPANPGTTPEAASSPAPLAPAEAVPGYEVLQELGRGGMGVVYLARQAKLNRVVALKMILAGSHAGPAARARFKTEAGAIARLQHQAIAAIQEVGEHEGKPFFSLEYCPGGSLDRKLA